MKTAFAFLLLALSCASTVSAVTIEMVTVGNAGNAPDTRYNDISVGSVGYDYQIGKYEVTAGQYTEFLNAVAKDDPNGLYKTKMGDAGGDGAFTFGANIQRFGPSGHYFYSVAADWANRPVNYVSLWDSARFANWLHNGQPVGPQGPGTTEGGAYHNVGDQTLFGRNADAKFFIPTENEWYKAAYHKNDGVTGNYWDYPTASNTPPINTPDPGTGNHANFLDVYGTGNNRFTTGGPYYRTEVGAFAYSASPYGTFDQGGNVMEWNETAISSRRGLRGGSFDYGWDLLHASARDFNMLPTVEYRFVGFRVASIAETNIPEPSTLLLGVLASFGMLARRRR